jgi:hypothetical protein
MARISIIDPIFLDATRATGVVGITIDEAYDVLAAQTAGTRTKRGLAQRANELVKRRLLARRFEYFVPEGMTSMVRRYRYYAPEFVRASDGPYELGE